MSTRTAHLLRTGDALRICGYRATVVGTPTDLPLAYAGAQPAVRIPISWIDQPPAPYGTKPYATAGRTSRCSLV